MANRKYYSIDFPIVKSFLGIFPYFPPATSKKSPGFIHREIFWKYYFPHLVFRQIIYPRYGILQLQDIRTQAHNYCTHVILRRLGRNQKRRQLLGRISLVAGNQALCLLPSGTIAGQYQ